jgi:hypothetical protein
MWVLVKRILRRYRYPPDMQDAAVQTVLVQAEALSAQWATSVGGLLVILGRPRGQDLVRWFRRIGNRGDGNDSMW